MHIVFYNHNTRRIGTFLRCLNLGRHLAKNGYKITLVSVNPEITMTIKKKKIDKINLIELPKMKEETESERRDYLGRGLRYFLSALTSLKMKCDLVHTFAVAHLSTAIPALVSKFIRHVPVVVDWDDWWGRGGLARYHGMLIHTMMTTLEEQIPLMMDGLTAISSILVNRAISLGLPSSKVLLLPSGVDVDYVKPLPKNLSRSILGLNNDQKIITYIGGAMTPREHILLLVNSIHHLLKLTRHDFKVKMMFVGVSPDLIVQTCIKKLGVRDYVIFFKWQPYERIIHFLSASDILALPIEKKIEDIARWPGRMADYLASSRPIVATAYGEVGKVIREGYCGLLANENNPNEFAERFLELLNNPDLCERLGSNARRLAEEKYDWSKIVHILEDFYHRIVTC